MRIGVLSHLHHPIREPFAGGLEAHTAQTVAALSRRGHDVVMYAREGTAVGPGVEVVPVLGEHAFGPVPAVVDVDEFEAVMESAFESAVADLRGRGVDVVLNASLNAVPYRAIADLPMLTILHTPASLERILRVVRSPLWTRSPLHRWVSVSASNARAWRADLGAVDVVHNGIALDRWSPGVGGGGFAAWTGRITPEKGLDLAIDACREAGIALRIAGPVSDAEHFDRDIAPRLGDDVRYLGHLPHTRLARLLRECEVFVNSPRWAEPFGLVCVEAMACGAPVATLPMGATAEVLGASGGIVAASTDATALAVAIGAAQGLDRRTVRARAERFSEERMIARYERHLVELVRIGRGRAVG